MVRINTPFDSDQHPMAWLLQGDDIAMSHCGQCGTPAKDWPHQAARHGDKRPGVMFKGELFCCGCRTWAFDEHTGAHVESFTGEPNDGPEPENHARMHRFLRNQANEQAKQSDNCMACGERFSPDDFRLDGEGPMTSVFRLVPLTDCARGWIADNVSRTEGYQPDWPTLHIEHRYLDDIIEGIKWAGMTVATRTMQPVGAL